MRNTARGNTDRPHRQIPTKIASACSTFGPQGFLARSSGRTIQVNGRHDGGAGHGASRPVGPRSTVGSCPRYAGLTTFRPGCLASKTSMAANVAVVGIPFDTGVSYRPGARFGACTHPAVLTRAAALQTRPLEVVPRSPASRLVDAGDIICTPVRHRRRGTPDRRAGVGPLIDGGRKDCQPRRATTPSPIPCCGRITAAMDQWRWCTSTLTSTPGTRISTPRLTHGTPFRIARRRRGALFVRRTQRATSAFAGHCTHPKISTTTRKLGFTVVHCSAFESAHGSADVVEQLRSTIGDQSASTSRSTSTSSTPAHAPATGTPRDRRPVEAANSSGWYAVSRDSNLVGGGTIVEGPRPAYDHAEITGIAARRISHMSSSPCWHRSPADERRAASPDRLAQRRAQRSVVQLRCRRRGPPCSGSPSSTPAGCRRSVIRAYGPLITGVPRLLKNTCQTRCHVKPSSCRATPPCDYPDVIRAIVRCRT